MNFLRNLLAAILGCLFAFGIIFVMFLFFVALIGSGEDTVTIKSNSVLELQIESPVSDYVGDIADDPFAIFSGSSIGLDEILYAIKVAMQDLIMFL